VQSGATRHGIAGIHGNAGIVKSRRCDENCRMTDDEIPEQPADSEVDPDVLASEHEDEEKDREKIVAGQVDT
jgi:hypothetical protein